MYLGSDGSTGVLLLYGLWKLYVVLLYIRDCGLEAHSRIMFFATILDVCRGHWERADWGGIRQGRMAGRFWTYQKCYVALHGTGG